MRLGLGNDISVGYRQPLFGGVPLLDTYTGAAAAYSLRQLRTGVTNVVRVRRDTTPSAEQDFTAEEITDGTLLAFVGAGNNGYVVTWYDQSGNTGRDATQSTAANQPKIVDAGVLVEENGKPTIDFDGNDDFLAVAYKVNTVPIAALVVQKYNTVNGNQISVSISEVNLGLIYLTWKFSSTENRYGFGDGSVNHIGDFTTPTTNQILSSIFTNSSTAQTFENGSIVGSYSSPTLKTSAQNINIARYSLGGFYADVKIQEVIIYDSDQSANRTAIEQNINDHYNIYP